MLKGKKVSSARRGSYFGYSHPEVKSKRLHEENVRAEVEQKAKVALKKKKLALKAQADAEEAAHAAHVTAAKAALEAQEAQVRKRVRVSETQPSY